MTKLAFLFLLATGTLHAQTSLWQPSPGHTQLSLWPGAPPDAHLTGPETFGSETIDLVAGKPWTYIENVSRPTMTVYSPQGRNTGAAVVVFPGGGYQILAIDLEGSEVCDWLIAKGITCILLKYRVPGESKATSYERAYKSGPYPESPEALEDAQRALGLVRLHASEWHIDPHRIGVLGFSAGGHMVAAISVHFDRRIYPPTDAADQQSCRPDFAIALYPGHLSLAENTIRINPDIRSHITLSTPPTFLLQNEDDHVDSVEDSVSYFMALKQVGVPVEMHIYAQGGHAFGLRPTEFSASHWPRLVETWLSTIGILTPYPTP